MKRLWSSILLAGAALGCFAEPLAVNGKFDADTADKTMPKNWVQNKGNWFKPYGVVSFAGDNTLGVVTNGEKSVYVDETTRFPAAPGAMLSLTIQAKGKGHVGFLVHLYNSKGKRITTLTSAQPVKADGGVIKYSCRLKPEYTGVEKVDLAPAFLAVGLFIEKNSDVKLSDFTADYRAESVNTALVPQTRTDWAAGTYRALTEQAAREKEVPLMFLGDSHTQLWGFETTNKYPGGLEVWNREFKPLGAVNYGVAGDMIQNVLWRITSGAQLVGKPRVIVLLIGGNNMHQSPVNTPDEIVNGIDNLVGEIRKQLPKSKILLLGIPPRNGNFPVAEINGKLDGIARKRGISFLDVGPILLRGKQEIDPAIFRDGLHLSPAGYELLAQSILPEIRRLMATAAEANFVLPEQKGAYKIYLAPDAVAAERKAAEELQYFWARLFGETAEIVSVMPADGKAVLIGQSAEAARRLKDVDFGSLRHDEIIVRRDGDALILAGDRPRGSLYAVYTLLEDAFGVKFYSSYEQEVPRLSKFELPNLNFRYAPVIARRGAFFHDLVYTDQKFAVRMRNHEDFLKGMDEFGCDIRFVGGVHSFDRLIPWAKYGKSDPEFFSLRGSERIGGQLKGQLCLSNERMRRELTANLLDVLRKNPNATMVSVSQNDNTNYCECTDCRAEAEREGSQAGPMIRFVNQVAGEVAKEFPRVTVQTFAYQYTTTPPKTARPRSNVEVRLCTIGSNFGAPLDSDANIAFREELRGWAKIAPRLSIWNYVTNFSNYLTPYPNLRSLADDIRFFGQNNVNAVFEQGDWNSGGITGDFVALKAYVISKLLWNPQLDPQALIDSFVDGYYGAAAPQIKAYLTLMEQEVARNQTYLGCFVDRADTVLAPETLLAGYKLMCEADAAVAAADPALRERVAIAGLPIRFAMLERALPLRRKYGKELPDFDRLYLDVMAVALRNRTRKYQENKAFDAYAALLRTQLERARNYRDVPVRPAVSTANLKPGEFFEMQESIRVPVADAAASDGEAARISGERYTWAIQFHPSLDSFPMNTGKYRLYAACRAELTPGRNAEGNAFEAGSYDRRTKKITMVNIPLADSTSSQYREFDLGIHELNPNCYLYVAPKKNEAMQFLYVDRIIAIPVR